MKAILLFANEDDALASRMQVGLDLTRAFEGHLTCFQVTPYDAFIMGDPFGGVYALPTMVQALGEAEDAHRGRMEAQLGHEGVAWDWLHRDGQAAQILVDRSRLADLVVMSLPAAHGRQDGPISLTADVALHAGSPVLAVPRDATSLDCSGIAVLAWNGSAEASHALRSALPMLRLAAAVHIVTVTDHDSVFPATDASHYLALHGIGSELHERQQDGEDIVDVILGAAQELGAAYIVMGAYGHSRIREAVLGGATRDMLSRSDLPVLLAH
jgi:nucleotide-binding universal stress UspA family protein